MSNSIKEEFVDALGRVCDKAYKLEEDTYPKFLRKAWEEQVTAARAIVGQGASPYDNGIATQAAELEGVTVADWANGVLATNHEFVQARLELAGIFKQATAAVMAASDDALVPTLEGLRPLAVQAALQVGSTDTQDTILTNMINNCFNTYIELLDPVELQDEEI